MTVVAWRRCISALSFVSLLLQPSQFASAAVCPKVPVGSFPDASMLRAMTCVDPAVVSGVPQSAGKIVFSDLAQISTKGSTCSKTKYEIKALVPANSGNMTLGASTCALSAVGLSKSSDLTVQMRLDFGGCTVGPTTATVLLNVGKATDFMAPTSSFPFLKKVCEAKTVTPKPSSATVELSFAETLVGGGHCVAKAILSSWKRTWPEGAGADKRACKMLCINDVQKAFTSGGDAALKNNNELCTGYAFTTGGPNGDDVCNLYKGSTPNAITKQEPLWNCFNLTASETIATKSTPAPPTAEELAAMEAKLPRLNLNVAPDAKSASVLTFSSPNATACYAPFNLITLQDSAFNTIEAGVSPTEWLELLEMLPPVGAYHPVRRLDEAVATPVSSVQADRVSYAGAVLEPLAAATPGVVGAVATTGALGKGSLNKTAAKPTCRPVPDEVANTIPVTIINLILGCGVVAAAYFGFQYGKTQAAPAGYAPVK